MDVGVGEGALADSPYPTHVSPSGCLGPPGFASFPVGLPLGRKVNLGTIQTVIKCQFFALPFGTKATKFS